MNVKITGDAYTVISNLTVAQIEKLEKYNPAANTLCDKDGNALFRVNFSKKEGGLGRYGITYNTIVGDKAALTVMLPSNLSADAKKQYVVDSLAYSLQNFEATEKQMLDTEKIVDTLVKTTTDKIVVND